jgi:hypothetical protein
MARRVIKELADALLKRMAAERHEEPAPTQLRTGGFVERRGERTPLDTVRQSPPVRVALEVNDSSAAARRVPGTTRPSARHSSA